MYHISNATAINNYEFQESLGCNLVYAFFVPCIILMSRVWYDYRQICFFYFSEPHASHTTLQRKKRLQRLWRYDKR